MQDENFDGIEELKNAEDNQVFSKVDKEISEKDFPQYSEFPVEPTPDGLSYKASKPTVVREEPTIKETQGSTSPTYAKYSERKSSDSLQ